MLSYFSLKLFKNQYKSFENFCQQALGISHWQINRQICAARTVLELIYHGCEILPKNEAQCREIACYVGSELVRVWQEIIEKIPPHQITAKTIHEFLHEEEEIEEDEENTTVKLPRRLYAYMLKEAVDLGLSIVGLLEEMFFGRVEAVPIGTELAWERDCENLIAEYELREING